MKELFKKVLKAIIAYFLNIFIVIDKKKEKKVRKVYVGLKFRFLGLLSFAMIIVFVIIALVINISQTNLLKREKNARAAELIQVLSNAAEDFLDNDITTSKSIKESKRDIINNEATIFKNYNKDIVKIILAGIDEKIKFSTDNSDLNKSYDYVIMTIKHKKEEPRFKNIKIKNKKNKKEKYQSTYYPIYMHKGEVVNIVNDFEKYYKKYHDSNSLNEKNKIYLILWRKYMDDLQRDFDPNIYPAPKGVPDKVIKAWDIDFLFLRLFSNIINKRKERIKKDEAWLWKSRWLEVEKENKLNAYHNDNAKIANESNKIIIDRMNNLYTQIKDIKHLGSLIILYDIKKIKSDINKNTGAGLGIIFLIFFISIVLFYLVIDLIIKNLKELERWALEVGQGELDTKIKINTRDEIGRLSDIFNHMIDELKTKFHLEKFVSQSTRSMIKQKKDSKTSIGLGSTGKKNFAFIFSDVRGFTSFSEKNNPDTVIEILNLYFDLQSQIIKSKKGDIDDYVGDQIMAHFGGEKRADTAIKVALEISKEINKLNKKRKKENKPYFEVGIGIHGGDVVVGNIGSRFRMDFACIGDAVNLTSRLCSAAGPGEILVSKNLYDKAKGKYNTKDVPAIAVKGKDKKIEVLKLLT